MFSAKLYQGEPDYATPPGMILEDILDQKNLTQIELAQKMGLHKKTICEIIKGTAVITAETAKGLERVLDVPATFWLNAENIYQIRKKKIEENLAQYKKILTNPTIKELLARKLISEYQTPEEGVENVLRFFGVSSVKVLLKQFNQMPIMMFKHSEKITGSQVALAAWLQIGRRTCQTMSCDPYNAEKFRAFLDEVRSFTLDDPSVFIPKMIRGCAQCGVALSLIPEIKNCAVYGAASWITPSKAMILINLLGKRSDIFWFAFFHEAAHILRGKKKKKYIDSQDVKLSEVDQKEEEAADKFASDFLIPRKYAKELDYLKNNIAVKMFAEKLKIHSGIVVRRLQYEGKIRQCQMNELRLSYNWAVQN